MSFEPLPPSDTGGDSMQARAVAGRRPGSQAASGAPTVRASGIDGPACTGPQPGGEALSRWSSDLEQLGRYVVLGILGEGGMGIVLKAFDRTLDRPVALKVLHRELEQEHTIRLRREAQAMAKLSHPNVVQVYEVAEVEGQTFVAMELVEGKSLRKWMEQSPSPGWRECVNVFLGAGAGLAAAHEEGLVHRDFKPDNAVIDEKGRPRVLDFGLARQAEADGEQAKADGEGDEEVRERPVTEMCDTALGTPLTRAGTVVGTPGYMPLEQLKGIETDARSDQFSYCVTLFEALYGKRPFSAATMAAQMVAMLDGEVRPAPKGTKVPVALRKVLLRGLATEPENRWPSMEALLAELRRVVAPRRKGPMAVGLFAGLSLVSLSIVYGVDQGQRCEGARDKLKGIWDDARITEVEDALLSTGLSYAPDTWARVELRLRDYADTWVEKHTEVCEATSVRQEQSAEVMGLRMECLRGRRVALREAVAVLAEADEARVRKAVSVVTGLPRISRCDDVEALRAELRPPEDSQVAAEVADQRERLQRALALEQAGAYEEASTVVEEVAAQAETLAYGPLLAEALFRRGSLRDKTGAYAESVADLEQALALAGEHGLDAVTTMALALLTRVVGAQQGHDEQGLVWGKVALSVSRGPGVEPLTEAFVLNNLGIVRKTQSKYDKSLTLYRDALTIREHALGSEHPSVAGLLSNIGTVLLSQGKHDESLEHHRRALAIQEQTLGPGHPDLAISFNSIGNVFQGQGAYDEALVEFRRAQAIFEGALGPEHPHVARSLHNIAQVLMRQGEYQEARTKLERALLIMEDAHGPNHPDVATTINTVGMVLGSEGKYAEALTYFQRALAINEEVLGPTHASLAHALHNIGTVFEIQGQHAQALEHHRRALAISEEAVGSTHASVGKARSKIGKVLQGQGALAEAAAEFHRALVILEDALGPEHPTTVYPMVGLAEVALEQGEFEVAREHAERVVSVRESAGTAAPGLADARFLLARALWPSASQRPRAHGLALKARDGYIDDLQGHDDGLPAIERWLAGHATP
ncbi:MAG: serine/threonine-protein kinase [Nannocystaceae bacterium]|nr:serine/threonine-protein kinase [Nannocystaceae bacterium]